MSDLFRQNKNGSITFLKSGWYSFSFGGGEFRLEFCEGSRIEQRKEKVPRAPIGPGGGERGPMPAPDAQD